MLGLPNWKILKLSINYIFLKLKLLLFEASEMDRTAESVPKTTLNKPCALPSSMKLYLILAGFMSPAEDVQIFVAGLCIVIKLNATALRSLG